MQVFNDQYFKTIFTTHYDKVFSGFLKKTKSEATAQELTQITFIKFWEYRSSYTFELSAEIQLYRKAKLVFIDWLRKKAYQRKLSEKMKEHSLTHIKWENFEVTDSIKYAMEQLPPVRKKVFSLAYIDGFSHKEIAEKLNISTKTVSNHILKALQQLRKILAFIAILEIIQK